MAVATTDPIRLPPAPRIPKLLLGLGFLARESALRALARRYGSAFTLRLPIFGDVVVISDPVLIKELLTASPDLAVRAGVLGEMFGPGSTFSLQGAAHRERRKLLVPALHGKSMQAYEAIVEEEVLRETASWPQGREFEALPSMLRITLNSILRTVFGAEGTALHELRELLPPMVLLGARLAALPPIARRDMGAWSPGAKLARYRCHYDAIIRRLIADIRNGPGLEQRTDVLTLMLRARHEDGSPLSDDHIADELLTLLAAGHETTATALAWVIERLRRHPRLLARLTAEADAGGSELRQATIWEVQRTRPVIADTARTVKTRIKLGEWVIPERHVVLASITLAHASEQSFPHAASFNPDRFIGNPPDIHTWIAYGGGVRRCIGAAYANMEINVALRTLLREFEFGTTYDRGERPHFRGVATAPARGGRAVVFRRVTRPAVTTPASQRVSVRPGRAGAR
ncbi:cytochrome P450 [Mycobacterium sp. 852002-50816_SCH5313054-b]|uniref:cytochrome P450 n=1 Tax=Mycobacterium sp. 852002-50816_SCH5313054-b TaxID=1834092 RepID=UPI0007FFE1D0|nr:cytochrome P450 [Mycobacterium sp. 852002-50816_SCH5313054-b]OBF57999.1 cytochrome P450 [Mycobacterium sp. 852002-50816_SCH5313054-b]